jgi:hypothetical protein
VEAFGGLVQGPCLDGFDKIGRDAKSPEGGIDPHRDKFGGAVSRRQATADSNRRAGHSGQESDAATAEPPLPVGVLEGGFELVCRGERVWRVL